VGKLLINPYPIYMTKYKTNIKSYSLIVVCGGSGLERSIKDAVNVLGKNPEQVEKYLASQVAKNSYDLEKFVS
jgi:hypothetical protein